MPIPPPQFGVVNYAALVIYFAAMLGVGWWAGRRVKSSSGYFVAEGKMGAVLVGLSLLGTYLSAMTMMGLPGKSFGPDDLTYTIQLPFLLLTAYVITRFVLPRYRAAGVLSVYEYLEQRIDISARTLAALSFVALAIARMGMSVFLPALALNKAAGIDLDTAILSMGLVMTAYTVWGGMEAVIWTDAVQVVIFAVAAIYSVGAILLQIEPSQFMQIAEEHHKLRVFAPGFDWTKPLTIWLVIETILSTIRIYGTQQDMTQRYVSTESTAEANRSVWISILGYIPLAYLFYFMGVALFVYYQAHPDPYVAQLTAEKRADAVYPYFVTTRCPPGMAGLVVAGILAAAMSTVAALMNSTSVVCVVDFYRRFRGGERSDRHDLGVARWLTLVWGLLTIVMAFRMRDMQSAVDTWISIMGFTANGVLGLMALAFLPFRVHPWAAIAGFVTGNALVLYLRYGLATPPFVLLYTVVGSITCFVVGYLVHLLLAAAGVRPANPVSEATATAE